MSTTPPPVPESNKSPSPSSSNGDNENVREQLKKTSIQPNVSRPASAAADHNKDAIMTDDQPRPARSRKRSHDESEEDNLAANGAKDEDEGEKRGTRRRRQGGHERKRSREISDVERIRARSVGKGKEEHVQEEDERMEVEKTEEANEKKRAVQDGDEEREKKISKTEEKPETGAETKATATTTISSGWSNTSSASPFATSAAGSKPLFGPGSSTTTSSSTSTSTAPAPAGFAASKFGQLSTSTKSPFATMGSSTPSLFGSSNTNSPFAPKPISGLSSSSTPSAFGGSAFGAAPSAGSSIFGSGKPVASSSNPFGGAAKLGTSAFGAGGKIKSTRPFGAPEEGGEDNEDGGDAEEGDVEAGNQVGDEAANVAVDPEIRAKFEKETEVHTGEEHETQLFKAPMKVYTFDKAEKAWKERGRCIVKLNVTEPPEEERFAVFEDGGKGRKKRKGKKEVASRKVAPAPPAATGFKLYEPKPEKSETEKTDDKPAAETESKPESDADKPADDKPEPKDEKKPETEAEPEPKEPEVKAPEVPKKRARFILRSEGTHNVVLNTYVYKGMPFGHPKGSMKPTGNQVTLITGPEGGIWIFKAKQSVVEELWAAVERVKGELFGEEEESGV